MQTFYIWDNEKSREVEESPVNNAGCSLQATRTFSLKITEKLMLEFDSPSGSLSLKLSWTPLDIIEIEIKFVATYNMLLFTE